METFTVRLQRVTKDDAQYALDSMNEIYDAFDIDDEMRLSLWEYYRILATDVLIRFGELAPNTGDPEHNGLG